MRESLRRQLVVVSNLQHNVLPGAHIEESHPSPNAFVQRSSLLDSNTSNGRFCSRKSLVNGAWGIGSNRSRLVSFERVAITPNRSKYMLGKVCADGGTKVDSASRTYGSSQQSDLITHDCGTRSDAYYHTCGMSIYCVHKPERSMWRCLCNISLHEPLTMIPQSANILVSLSSSHFTLSAGDPRSAPAVEPHARPA